MVSYPGGSEWPMYTTTWQDVDDQSLIYRCAVEIYLRALQGADEDVKINHAAKVAVALYKRCDELLGTEEDDTNAQP